VAFDRNCRAVTGLARYNLDKCQPIPQREDRPSEKSLQREDKMEANGLKRLSLILIVGLILGSILACDFGGGAGTATPLVTPESPGTVTPPVTPESPGTAKPRVTLESPTSGIELEVGQQVEIVCLVEDPKGGVSVELAVDGVLYAAQGSPNAGGQPQWKFVDTWAAQVDPGIHILTITAYNVDKVASDPVAITVTVVEGAAPEGTGAVTLATSTPPPGTTATLPPVRPTQTTAAPPPTNTPVSPPGPTNTPVPPPTPTNTPVPPPPALPDLIIYAIYLDRDSVSFRGTVHAQVVVVNRGNTPAGAFRVSWEFGSGSGGQNVPCCLGPNQSYSLEWDSLPLYTSYNTRAMADESQMVQESSEDNNTLTRWVNVAAAQPDLIVTEIRITPDLVPPGATAFAQITVRNQGTAAVGAFAVTWRYAPSTSYDWDVSALGPGEQTTLECTTGPLVTSHRTRADVDPAGLVQESDEGNNSLDRWVNVG